MPDLYNPGPGDGSQHQRLSQHTHLSPDDYFSFGKTVRQGTAPQAEWDERDEPHQVDNAQGCRRTGQTVDQHLLGHGLHPGANQRNTLAEEPEAVVVVSKGAKSRWGHKIII